MLSTRSVTEAADCIEQSAMKRQKKKLKNAEELGRISRIAGQDPLVLPARFAGEDRVVLPTLIEGQDRFVLSDRIAGQDRFVLPKRIAPSGSITSWANAD